MARQQLMSDSTALAYAAAGALLLAPLAGCTLFPKVADLQYEEGRWHLAWGQWASERGDYRYEWVDAPSFAFEDVNRSAILLATRLVHPAERTTFHLAVSGNYYSFGMSVNQEEVYRVGANEPHDVEFSVDLDPEPHRIRVVFTAVARYGNSNPRSESGSIRLSVLDNAQAW